jgi:hypothetical protein
MHPLNPLSGNAPYFSILLYLTPDNFTHQVESAATQWVNWYNNLFTGTSTFTLAMNQCK